MDRAIVQWLRTRMLSKKIMALWVLLVVSCLIVQPGMLTNLLSICLLVVAVNFLMMALRLWDDLADRAFDRQRPAAGTRVIARLDELALRPFYGWVVVLLLASAGLLYLLHGGSVVAGLLGLIGFMALVYSYLPALTEWRALRMVLVLLKYPAMLMLLSGGQLNLMMGSTALGLYALLLTYECYESLKKTYDNTH